MANGAGGFLKPKHPKTAAPEQPADPYADLYGYVQPPAKDAGFWEQARYINRTSPEVFMQLGAGLMSGDAAGGLSNAAQALSAGTEQQRRAQLGLYRHQEGERAKSLTKEWLRSKFPDASDAELDAMSSNPEILNHVLAAPKGTDDITEYNLAQQQGFQGSFVDFKLAQIKAGVPTPPPPVGTPPAGYELFMTPEGTYQMRPIAGGPADTSKKDIVRQAQQDVQTDIIVTAAERAREAAKSRAFGPYGQKLVADWFKTSDAAETVRQVEVLRSQAKVENLQKMRDASPTGGALGSVTQDETKMLADKSGALDPESPNFERDVNDYERTLLRVIHGPEVGEQIYQSTRRRKETPTITTQEEYDALQSGDEYIEDGVRYKKP